VIAYAHFTKTGPQLKIFSAHSEARHGAEKLCEHALKGCLYAELDDNHWLLCGLRLPEADGNVIALQGSDRDACYISSPYAARLHTKGLGCNVNMKWNKSTL
jgi:hypothetical protein